MKNCGCSDRHQPTTEPFAALSPKAVGEVIGEPLIAQLCRVPAANEAQCVCVVMDESIAPC